LSMSVTANTIVIGNAENLFTDPLTGTVTAIPATSGDAALKVGAGKKLTLLGNGTVITTLADATGAGLFPDPLSTIAYTPTPAVPAEVAPAEYGFLVLGAPGGPTTFTLVGDTAITPNANLLVEAGSTLEVNDQTL